MTEPGDEIRPSRLGAASVVLASGTIVSRILGFVRVVVLAAAIGQVASASADAFAIANQLPNSIYALTVGGLLSAVLVPQIVRAGKNPDGGAAYINKVITLGILVFATVTIIAVIAAPALVELYSHSSDSGRGFSPETLALATTFAYLCLPQVFFYALYSLLSETLNARNVFGPFAWAPVINNVVSIAGIVVFMILFGDAQQNRMVDVWSGDRILLLAGTATLGVAAQAIVVVGFWKRAGLRYRPDFRWRGVGLATTGKATGWLFGMIIVTQLAAIVQSQVATLASGTAASIAALQYSWLIFMLPHSVVAVSIATAYFTRMSGHAARSDLLSLRSDLSASLRGIGLIMVFSTVALAVVAYPFARFFESRFDNVQAMGNVILGFLPGLVLFSALFVVQRVFYSLGDTRTPFFLQLLQSVIFAGGSLACILLPSEWIAVGIAVATSVAGGSQAIVALVLVRRRLGGHGGLRVVRRHVQYLGLAVVAAAAGLVVLLLLGGLNAGGFAQSGQLAAFLSIMAIGAVMAAVYGGLLLLFRNPELSVVQRALVRRFARRAEE
ncbi:putative peptidoglycan lipid II flippase [Cryobacterium mesophilum]|uniref:Murein biosynthesis integral membrane protein MurJ n=1 Tax=Terrimesophilobacter mesophilus TaxID=433647 RepID=A0A4R8VDE7_9MICO|nr:murein biosynthesis integral membrane protein MurJ [Terrimesophilobacter mesophilus]MBB5633099.1 putative peptidoglycan lipid II flippase [Terrimesophilobacter mesophilus]TFB79857.1 murein biosynthesis integral membrane protein MurJ [Terrimesophilobacter mesophilus]